MSESSGQKRPIVAVLGVGEMGLALVRGLLLAGWSAETLSLAVRREERAREVEERTGCPALLSAVEALDGAGVVVVAVKPQGVPQLLEEIRGSVGADQLVISLAAGVKTADYEEALGEVAVVRAMPNTPALVREGITGIAAGRWAEEPHLTLASSVLGAVGPVETLDEGLMDAVTAVSGTGPAYAFLMAEALTEAAVREGLPRAVAQRLVHQTLRGAGTLLMATDKSPRQLRMQVTSPGGTTAAAMHVLEESGFRGLLENAVRAAARRSRELGELD